MRFFLGRFVDSDEYLIRTRRLPPLAESGVRYATEREDLYSPKPVEDWLLADVLLQRRYGDCEDLAAYRCAELRLRGVNAHPQISRKGNIWHVTVAVYPGKPSRNSVGAVVRREDPSRALGMGATA